MYTKEEMIALVNYWDDKWCFQYEQGHELSFAEWLDQIGNEWLNNQKENKSMKKYTVSAKIINKTIQAIRITEQGQEAGDDDCVEYNTVSEIEAESGVEAMDIFIINLVDSNLVNSKENEVM
jgi:hypothetical protein